MSLYLSVWWNVQKMKCRLTVMWCYETANALLSLINKVNTQNTEHLSAFFCAEQKTQNSCRVAKQLCYQINALAARCCFPADTDKSLPGKLDSLTPRSWGRDIEIIINTLKFVVTFCDLSRYVSMNNSTMTSQEVYLHRRILALGPHSPGNRHRHLTSNCCC